MVEFIFGCFVSGRVKVKVITKSVLRVQTHVQVCNVEVLESCFTIYCVRDNSNCIFYIRNIF